MNIVEQLFKQQQIKANRERQAVIDQHREELARKAMEQRALRGIPEPPTPEQQREVFRETSERLKQQAIEAKEKIAADKKAAEDFRANFPDTMKKLREKRAERAEQVNACFYMDR